MIKNKTRVRVTWYALLVATIISVVGILNGMEAVAVTGLGVVSTVSMAYIGSKAYTNGKFIQHNDGQTPSPK